MAQRRDGSNTKAEIRRVALELFAERGYDATSLREIAERLDITKAALYYHYKSKEDIVRSLLETYFEAVDELTTWIRAQPRTPETLSEALARWTATVRGHGADVSRLLQNNQHVIADMKGDFRGTFVTLMDAIDDPEAPFEVRVRYRLAFLSIHTALVAGLGLAEPGDPLRDEDQVITIAESIAREMLDAAPASTTRL